MRSQFEGSHHNETCVINVKQLRTVFIDLFGGKIPTDNEATLMFNVPT